MFDKRVGRRLSIKRVGMDINSLKWLGSLRARLFALMLLGGLPGFLVAILDSFEDVRQEQQIATSSIKAAFARVEQAYGSTLQWARVDLADAARQLSENHISCQKAFDRALSLYPQYRSAGLIDGDGQVVCEVASAGHEITTPNGDLLLQALQVGTARSVAAFEKSSNSGAMQLVTAVEIIGDGKKKQVAFITAEFMALADIVADTPLSKIQPTYIAPVRRGTAESLNAKNSSSRPVSSVSIDTIDAFWATPPAQISLDHGGTEMVDRFPLGENGGAGIVELSVPIHLADDQVRNALMRNLTLLLAGLLLAGVALWWIGYRLILEPGRAVLRTISRLAQGNLSQRTGVAHASTEIGQLASSIDHMADDLQRREQERSAHLKSLERANRLHRMLAAVHEAITQRLGVELLLEEVCRITCRVGDLSMAWVGEVDRGGRFLRVVRSDDISVAFVHDDTFPIEENLPGGKSPIAVTARTGKASIDNHYLRSKEDDVIKLRCSRNDVRSLAAIPMGFVAFGQRRVLVVGAQQEGYFEAEEVHLLTQLAKDAAVGVHLAKTEQTLAHSNTHDPVTSLPNAALLQKRLLDEVVRSKKNKTSILVAILDIGFQHLVSTWGSEPAELLLRRVALEAESAVDCQGCVGALPGARFGVVVGNLINVELAEQKIEALLDQLSTAQMVWQDELLAPAPRIGIAFFPKDAADVSGLLDKAAAALTMTRSERTNAIRFFSPTVSATLKEERQLEKELSFAIERNELHLLYQPIVNVASGSISGCEALLRWNHPRLGELSPTLFIPMAERSGLIHSIGQWVISEAVRQAAVWESSASTEMFIAINLSAAQVSNIQFGEHVKKQLKLNRRLGHKVRLVIEITESQLIGDVELVIKLLDEIRALGVGIVIDDFGTGYSSLSYLHRLPVDVLKIDKSFTDGMDSNSRVKMIVEGIVALADSLALKTVIEGVERDAQLEIAREMGVTYAQGFLFDRAMPAWEIQNKWLKFGG